MNTEGSSTINSAIQKFLAQNGVQKLEPKAVLFDMDGVLYDSMPFHAKAWKEVADRHGLVSSPADFYMFEGCTGAFTIDTLYQRSFGRYATQEEKEQIYQEKAVLFSQYNDGEAMTGVAEVLEKVSAHGLQRLVVTGSGQKSLIEKLEHTYPGQFTREKMVTAFDVTKGKPDPEPYLMGLKKAGVACNEAFVVENAPMGVKAGVAAHIFTIAVNTGPLPDSVLLEAGAHMLYHSMRDLANDWDNLMSACRDFR